MGSSQAKPAEFAKKEEIQTAAQELLNTGDLKAGLTYVATRGRSTTEVTPYDFEILFEVKAKLYGLLNENDHLKQLVESQQGRMTEEQFIKAFDMDGDGKITPKDFELLFNKNMNLIERNKEQLNALLPVAGQCVFGGVTGYSLGMFARSMVTYRMPVLMSGVTAYYCVQILAQKEYIHKQKLEEEFKKKVNNLCDYNGDGVIDFKDLEAVMDEKMKIVTTKIGPGGFMEGWMGTGTFLLCMLKGLRR